MEEKTTRKPDSGTGKENQEERTDQTPLGTLQWAHEGRKYKGGASVFLSSILPKIGEGEDSTEEVEINKDVLALPPLLTMSSH